MSTKKTRLVEVFGSLLDPKQREETFNKGTVKEQGKVKREGWKLSFDRKSKRWNGAVANFLFTGNREDVYYTTVFEVDDIAYAEVMEREMGKEKAKKWLQNKSISSNSYRPKTLDSEFGKTEVFIIPEEGREPTPAHWEDKYVKTIKEGIKKSYEKFPQQRKVNLNALKRAVEKSKTI